MTPPPRSSPARSQRDGTVADPSRSSTVVSDDAAAAFVTRSAAEEDVAPGDSPYMSMRRLRLLTAPDLARCDHQTSP
jgi:hypothetical protein